MVSEQLMILKLCIQQYLVPSLKFQLELSKFSVSSEILFTCHNMMETLNCQFCSIQSELQTLNLH